MILMCGISGYISAVNEEENLIRSLAAMAHRGPDNRGSWTNRFNNDHFIGLGHARLSIIDLSEESNQPLFSPCRNYVLCYNGEIYNFRELRVNIEKEKGVVFQTKGDAEVLLMGLILYGTNFISMLEGIFAFVFLDRNEKELILGRDHAGIKPLYYCHDEQGSLFFASEIEALMCYGEVKPEFDESCLYEFLCNGFLYEPRTGYKNITKIPQGSYLLVNSRGEYRTHRYYNILEAFDGDQKIYNKDCFGKLLKKTVEQQLVADVKIALFFSGGLDSSALLTVAPPHTDVLFLEYDEHGAAIDGSNNEKKHALSVSLKLGVEVDHVRIEGASMTCDEIIHSFRQVAEGTEELISDYTYLAAYSLSKVACLKGYKVILSGMGGDEAFAGYPRHLLCKYSSLFSAIKVGIQWARPWFMKSKRWGKKVDRFLSFFSDEPFILRYARLIGYFSAQEITDLMDGRSNEGKSLFLERMSNSCKQIEKVSDLKKAQYLDYLGFLPHNLMITDKAGMANSVEIRVPLLDSRLYREAMKMDDDYLIKWMWSKWPVRKYLIRKVGLKNAFRRKVGFNPPLDKKIQKLGRDRVCDELSQTPIYRYLNRVVAEHVINVHFTGEVNNTYKIWQLLYLGYWLEKIERLQTVGEQRQ